MYLVLGGRCMMADMMNQVVYCGKRTYARCMNTIVNPAKCFDGNFDHFVHASFIACIDLDCDDSKPRAVRQLPASCDGLLGGFSEVGEYDTLDASFDKGEDGFSSETGCALFFVRSDPDLEAYSVQVAQSTPKTHTRDQSDAAEACSCEGHCCGTT
jgi:hypothetical protein